MSRSIVPSHWNDGGNIESSASLRGALDDTPGGGGGLGFRSRCRGIETAGVADQIEEAKTWKNPFEATADNIEKGKAIFHGKAFCVTCHGKDGKGFGDIPGLVGKLPRNFTDKVWQAARTDGELIWILKNGSPGTDMASFIPLILTEEEAWHVLLYVRSFGQQ